MMRMSEWKKYKNGNYKCIINTRNGTKIRETEDDEFIPEFAENVDVLTSQCCENACPWCYAGCTPDGKHGELLSWKFLDTLHPYTEMALNLNFPIPPQFNELLQKLKSQNIITNITVAQNHFIANHEYIRSLINQKLIYGVGVSLTNPTEEFLEIIETFPTAVIHTINGVTGPIEFKKLLHSKYADKLKILILGYKNIGRGVHWKSGMNDEIISKQTWLYDALPEICDKFRVVSFDNLALEQLNVRRLLTDEEWDEFFMGKDGGYTFFIDLVTGTFGKNSLATERYPIMDSIDEMFQFIRSKEITV